MRKPRSFYKRMYLIIAWMLFTSWFTDLVVSAIGQNNERKPIQYQIIAAIIIIAMLAFFYVRYKRLNKELITTYERFKLQQDALIEIESRFEQLALQSKTFVWEVDANGVYTYVGKSVQEVIGYHPEELIGKKEVWELHPEAGREAFKAEVIQMMRSKDRLTGFENPIVAKDGKVLWFLSAGMPLLNESGELLGYRGWDTNIHYLKQIEQALRESEEKFRMLFKNMQEGVALHDIIYDDDHNAINYIIKDANPAFEKLAEIDMSEVINRKATTLWNVEKAPYLEEYAEVAKTGIPYAFETYFDQLQKQLRISVFSPRLGQFATVFEDITERKNTEEKIKYLSFHDSLTGLYNRRFFEEELKRLNTGRNLPLSIVMADVNGLKLANDAFGHLTGDKILQKAASLIKTECRFDDIVARIGGDEFVILLPKTGSKDAEYLVNRINKAVSNTNINSIDLSISFGWATKIEDNENIDKIYKQAEDSMYKRKLYESPSMRGNTIKTIIYTMHNKLPEEKEHANKVSEICEKIGMALGLNNNDIDALRTAGLMHDIGKITINEALFLKQDKLNDEERLEVKRHSENGYQILRSVSEMVHIAEYVLAHHENWDGTGYPKGLKGEEIPLQSRIIRIADSYDVMVSGRYYKDSLSKDEAIEEIKKHTGTQFDPRITKVFIEKVVVNLDD